MPDNQKSDEKQLTPADRQRAVITRSTLASRGLELALNVRQENERNAVDRSRPKWGLGVEEILLPGRTIQFPPDRSMGSLFLRRWNDPIITWGDIIEVDGLEFWPKLNTFLKLGDARGEFHIPSGGELLLYLDFDQKVDVSPLGAFASHDIQGIFANSTGAIWQGRFFDLDDEDMKSFQKLTGLLWLSLSSSNFTDNVITDEGLKFLQNLKGLRNLDLSNNCVTDGGLKFLQNLNSLRLLNLSHNRGVTDEGVKYLHGLHNLESLHLDKAAFNEAGVENLKHALRDCRISWYIEESGYTKIWHDDEEEKL